MDRIGLGPSHTHRNRSFPAAFATGGATFAFALLSLGSFALVAAERQPAAAEVRSAVAGSLEEVGSSAAARTLEAGADAVDQVERPVRRVRASMAMPYFSFAQSLRRGG